jgi:putative transcriptional regulator
MRKMFCRLAVLMAEKDTRLSQRKLAKDTGLSTNTINKLFHNEIDRVDRTTLEALCNYFSCDVGDLLTMREVPDEAMGD